MKTSQITILALKFTTNSFIIQCAMLVQELKGSYIIQSPQTRACPGFLKGGGPISLGSLKKRSSDFKRGGGPMV